ncbi:MAG: hypothetical protein V4467_01980 [Patescibacteria group bacterium]
MKIIELNSKLLRIWLLEYTGLTFVNDACYENGQWRELTGMSRLVSASSWRFSVRGAFFDELPKHKFAFGRSGGVGIPVYQEKSPHRHCWVAIDGGLQVLDVAIICELSRDQTGVIFSPQVRWIHHNLGDHSAEQGRRVTDLDPLFPILIQHGQFVGEKKPSFLDRIGEGVLRLSFKAMGHDLRSLSSLFTEFTGGNLAFQNIRSEFDPTPAKDFFVNATGADQVKVLQGWQQQLVTYKTKLVAAI